MKHLNHISLGFAVSFVLTVCLPTPGQAATVFVSTGSLEIPRGSHTATLLPNGKVLVVAGQRYVPSPYGGFSISLSLDSTELYDPATGLWLASGSLASARDDHTATLLPNGKVLVAGGHFGDGSTSSIVASAELYDPATGTWSSTGSLGVARRTATATLLTNGKVLAAGGIDANGLRSGSAELYDPATGIWSSTGSLGTARESHTATLLPNGKVLVAGGTDHSGYTLGSAELYNPATGTWSATGSFSASRSSHTATLLPTGKVLIVGGYGAQASAALYDPAIGTWTSTANLANGRMNHSATLLPNGKVLVGGGYFQGSTNAGPVARAELYDPGTGTWSLNASLSAPRYFHTATLLANGQVLVAGGTAPSGDYIYPYLNFSSVELYDSGTPFVNPIINPVRLGDGSFRFSFSGNPSGTNYHVLASPNPAAPVNTWSNLGLAIESPTGSGQFQFTDHQATNYPRCFYRVSSP